MNVVFSVRFFLASMTTISLVVLPRVLYYFGARANELDAMLSAWFTFIVLLIVGGLIVFPWLKVVKLAVFAVIAIFAIAAVLTFYFCNLALPW